MNTVCAKVLSITLSVYCLFSLQIIFFVLWHFQFLYDFRLNFDGLPLPFLQLNSPVSPQTDHFITEIFDFLEIYYLSHFKSLFP